MFTGLPLGWPSVRRPSISRDAISLYRGLSKKLGPMSGHCGEGFKVRVTGEGYNGDLLRQRYDVHLVYTILSKFTIRANSGA